MNISSIHIEPLPSELVSEARKMAFDEDMGSISDFSNTIAAIDGKILLGFLRIRWAEETPYVNPIVTNASYRRCGIGKKLMQAAFLKVERPLLLVARGNQIGFYQAIGCTKVPWSSIDHSFLAECEECPLLKDCEPQPLQFSGLQDALICP